MLNDKLQHAIAVAVGMPHADDLHLVQCSSSGATGAIILHAWRAGERDPRAVVKTPRDVRLNHALNREWEAVREVRRDPDLARLVPAALAAVDIDGARYYVYEGAAGRTMYSRYRNRILWPRAAMLDRFALQALDPLVCVHETRSRAAGAAEVAQDMLLDVAWLEATVQKVPAPVVERARALANRLGASRHSLPIGRVHGDFSPYNVITAAMSATAAVRLIDWEHSEADRPQHIDVFRFIGACALMGLRGAARRTVCSRMTQRDPVLQHALLRPWLDRMSASGAQCWMTPNALEALWWQYWIHAARREQERSAAPHDWRDSTYLNALLSLTTRSHADQAVATAAYAT